MRQKLLINDGWKFFEGEIPVKEVRGHYDTYMHSKGKNGLGAAAASYYDLDFKDVRIPHDYVLDGEVSNKFNESQGSYERKSAWYRRHFKLPCEMGKQRFTLLFDGAGKNTKVWVNGHFAGENQSLYNSFYMDITPYLLENEVNTISVYIQNDDIEGWWYEGAGIYRDVWMVITDEVAVDMWGTYVNPKLIEGESWDTLIETTVWNDSKDDINAQVIQSIVGADGVEIGSTISDIDTEYGENLLKQNISVENPKRWDVDDCNLYTLKTTIKVDGKITDEYETSFGYRTIKYDADKGFFLNGRSINQRGLCFHQDHANMGIAMSATLYQHRLNNMKDMGANAYRSAHNPTAPGLLDMCDRTGIMVMEENRWFNWSEKTKKEMDAMLKNARNHPSVVIWSVGNEEPLQITMTGTRLVDHLTKMVKSYDKSRPVTLALNSGYFDQYSAEASEILGANYNVPLYDKMKERHPNKPIIGSETSSYSGARGIYFAEDNGDRSGYRSDYDNGNANYSSCQGTIEGCEENEYICGTYLWTGTDYRGESMWPGLFANCGVTDACGFEKDKTYQVKSYWRDEPMVHVLPHWNLQGHEGEMIRVAVYTNGDKVELIVNGESQGVKDYIKYKPLEWQVEYQAGYIEAIAYKNGEIIARDKKVTTGEPETLVITNSFKGDITNTGEDTALFRISFTDKDGNHVPTADKRINVEILDANDGEVVSVSGGDKLDHEHARSHSCKMFNGLLQAIVKVKEGAKKVGIKATVDGTDYSETFEIDVVDAKPIPRLAICNRDLVVDNFKLWPVGDSFEDVEKEFRFEDMNTCTFIDISSYEQSVKTDYSVITGYTVYPESERKMAMQFNGFKGEFAIKIFHDRKCWPSPQPAEFITIRKDIKLDEVQDYQIPLIGFGSAEKIKIIIVAKNNEELKMENVHFVVLD